MNTAAQHRPAPQVPDQGHASIRVVSPYDDRLIGTVYAASPAEVEEAVRRAAVAAAEFRHSTPFERRSLLEALAQAIAVEALEQVD